ncbi:MAG: sigma-70 family RNA polymerase sigma factor [Nitrospinae bacterium]|nr:sigma-70 family RNA polymerase sigma factor [Nitrospinota bacterium]
MSEISVDIVNEAAKGDIKAFESIYREYFGFVANVAFRIVNHTDDAEDVAQEVFMTVYRNLKTFRGESSLKTWIYRITLNTALNRAKRLSRENKQTTGYNDDMAAAQDPLCVEDGIKKDENGKMIGGLLDALNPDQRACIVLRSLEGLSYQEIAETLNIPINTVRSRIKRAREAMMALSKEVARYEM